MKLDRRSFIRLIPVVAVAGGLLWVLRQSAKEPRRAHQVTATTLKAFDLRVAWDGDRPTLVDVSDYRLKVDGDVSKPLELTVDNLYSMPNVEKTLNITCVEGWAADVLWEGVPLSYLLNQAGASLKNIAHVAVEGITGYKTALSSDEVANSDNMIALKAGGIPLTIEHGYPARLVAPAIIGLGWVKYVTRITCINK